MRAKKKQVIYDYGSSRVVFFYCWFLFFLRKIISKKKEEKNLLELPRQWAARQAKRNRKRRKRSSFFLKYIFQFTVFFCVNTRKKINTIAIFRSFGLYIESMLQLIVFLNSLVMNTFVINLVLNTFKGEWNRTQFYLVFFRVSSKKKKATLVPFFANIETQL